MNSAIPANARLTTQDSLLQRSTRWLARSLVNHDQFGAYFEPLIQMVLPHWTAQGYRTSVRSIRQENDSVFTLVLQPGKRWPEFQAGQYVELTVEQNGARMTRCFSISSTPEQWRRSGTVELSIRVQDKGRITPWLREALKAGDWVTLSEAKGDFILRDARKPALFIAGGSGITPFRSILGELAARGSIQDAHLLYYCNGDTHLFKSEWEELQQRHPGLKVQLIDTLAEGFISAEQLQRYSPDFAQRDTYLCGPAPMIQLAQTILREQGVPDSQVFLEYFGPAPVPVDANLAGVVHFGQSGGQAEATKESPRTLLELAESAGLKPVYGCRLGVCHQCTCPKQSGIVFNRLTQSYSDSGREDIQLCISVPVGPVVIDL